MIREVYTDLPQDLNGMAALNASPKFPDEPDARDSIEDFDAPFNIGDYYGQRIRGWFLPPQNGDYTFYSSCDDDCELFVSKDDDPMNKKMILSQEDWSTHNEWER